MTNREHLIDFIRNGDKSSFGQSPMKWLEKNNLLEFSYMIDGQGTKNIKKNLLVFAYGIPICKCCKKEHRRVCGFGWKNGWALTCSEECRQMLSSVRQMGENNTSHKISQEDKKLSHMKQSNTMRNKILDGSFTPNSQNYLTHKMIGFLWDGKMRKVRSLWEMIYWIKNPNLQYESVRIKYFDTKSNRERVYITDFHDAITNTIIEVKPKKYQPTLTDKRIAVVAAGYNYLVVDEDYFDVCKTVEMVDKLRELSTNFADIEKRLKWLKAKK